MKKQSHKNARRNFLKQFAMMIAAIPVTSLILSACTKSGEDTPPNGQKALSESDPVAQALGYKQDASQVDTTKFPKKAGPAGIPQHCQTCAQFTAVNSSWGKCNIFTQGLVKSTGWCNSWVAKG